MANVFGLRCGGANSQSTEPFFLKIGSGDRKSSVDCGITDDRVRRSVGCSWLWCLVDLCTAWLFSSYLFLEGDPVPVSAPIGRPLQPDCPNVVFVVQDERFGNGRLTFLVGLFFGELLELRSLTVSLVNRLITQMSGLIVMGSRSRRRSRVAERCSNWIFGMFCGRWFDTCSFVVTDRLC